MGILDKPATYVNFLIEQKITTNQYLLLYLLFTEKMEKEGEELTWPDTGLISQWQEHGPGWIIEDIEDLIEKEFLINISDNIISLDKLILTSKFSDLIFVNATFAFQEFFESYPSTIPIKNETAFLKAVDPEIIEKLYTELIQGSAHKHQEFMELLEYGKERGLIKVRIDKYFTAKIWETIQKMKNEDEKGEDYGRELR